MKIIYVDSNKKMALCKNLFGKTKYKEMALDIETCNFNEGFTGLDFLTSSIRLVQIRVENFVFVVDLFKVDGVLDFLGQLLYEDEILPVIHNASFEYKQFKNKGLELPQLYCTMIADKVIYAGLPRYSFGYKDLVERHECVELDKTEQKSDWGSEILTPSQIKYAALDVVYPLSIKKKQMAIAKELEVADTISMEMTCAKIFYETEYHGLPFDRKIAKESYHSVQKEYEERLADLQKEFPALPLPQSAWNKPKKDGSQSLKKAWSMFPSGFKPIQGSRDIKNAFIQMGVEVPMKYNPKTQTSSPCFDKQHRKLVDHPLMAKVEPFCVLETVLTKYLNKMSQEDDGWMHPVSKKVHYSVDQVKSTGRISVSEPPLQQLPNTHGIRHCFTACPEMTKEAQDIIVKYFKKRVEATK